MTLDELNKPLREGFARINAERGEEPTSDILSVRFDDALRTMGRCSSYAGMTRAMAFVSEVYTEVVTLRGKVAELSKLLTPGAQA